MNNQKIYLVFDRPVRDTYNKALKLTVTDFRCVVEAVINTAQNQPSPDVGYVLRRNGQSMVL
jgi:hypothetical protein